MHHSRPRALWTMWTSWISLILIAAGCAKRGDDASTQYGLLKDVSSQSLLKVIDERGGKLDACLWIVDDPTESTANRTALESASRDLEKAVQGWNALLAGHPRWRWRTIDFRASTGSCSQKRAELYVELYRTEARWFSLCRTLGMAPNLSDCRSHAEPWKRLFRLDPNHLRTGASAANVIAHEYGHMLGLADLYDDANHAVGIEARNQPAMMGRSAVMGGTWTQDDANGIKAAWDAVLSGNRACDANSVDVSQDLEKNSQGSTFCLPPSSADTNTSPQVWHTGNTGNTALCRTGYTFDPGSQWCLPNATKQVQSDPCAPLGLVFQPQYRLCCPARSVYSPSSGLCEWTR